jgi:opacity protein-like surface antigen
MRIFSLLLLAALPAAAQHFTGGIKAGVPLTDFVDTAQSGQFTYFTHTDRYIVGVTGELRLPFGLGVELDALYRHVNFTGTGSLTGLATTTITTTSNAWEFPLLLKYRFPAPIARPFIDGGVAWDTLQGLKQSVSSTILGGSSTATASTTGNLGVNQTTTTGFVLGAGLDVHALFIHVQPEIRYTRWGAQHFLDPNGGFSSNRNQAEFLVGITF